LNASFIVSSFSTPENGVSKVSEQTHDFCQLQIFPLAVQNYINALVCATIKCSWAHTSTEPYVKIAVTT